MSAETTVLKYRKFSQSIQALWSLHLLSCKAAATGQTGSAEAKGTLLSMAVLILGRV